MKNASLVNLILLSAAIVVVCGLDPLSRVSKLRNSASPRFFSLSALNEDPLLVRVARGEDAERVPVWMMRQAGRHMQAYRDLCKTHKTFRERSENAHVAVEISLQPWKKYGTDGCILFSDILTPLPGMGIEFDILEKEGPTMKPLRTIFDVQLIKPIQPLQATPFVGEALQILRKEVGCSAAVLGFVGMPYTLATYLVEGGSSSEYKQTKTLAYREPAVLREMLRRLAENIADYALYQIESGAQVLQLFDSWAGSLSPADYDAFAAPYQRMVIERIKRARPEVPLILYINRSGALLERMAEVGVDIVSLDWTVNIDEARRRMGDKVGIQGNLDPMLLFAPDDVIRERTHEVLKMAGGRRHIMNLGHGIDPGTAEEKAQLFVDIVKEYPVRRTNR